ncbi:MAG: PPOX class F420-dependent oxidoreductase [Chloroflexota bacterium]|nr:PPOX class F420-dependent oxidoreductase [Chloroflexota bacterium]
MPARLSQSQREQFLAGRHVAVLVTVGPGGSPVPTPIWYLFRDGVFYFRTASDALKTQNVRRDPRVSICVQDERPPYRAVIAHGTADVVQSSDWLAREMPRHYLGAVGAIGYRVAARAQVEQGSEVTLRVRPERYATFDFSAETPVVGRVWLWLKRFLPAWL